MTQAPPVSEGYLPYRGYKTFYKVVGDLQSGETPLLVLHGGPGCGHDYVANLGALAERGRAVVFYDQLGCGRSDRPNDNNLWTVQLFVDEVDAVRRALNMSDLHLLGQSWGSMLAVEYLLTQPAGVHRVILASAMISMPLFRAEVAKLRQQLPEDVQRTLEQHESAGTTGDHEYKRAYREFHKRFIALRDWPELAPAWDAAFAEGVYSAMWGASEAYPNGSLQDWDRLDRLGEIHQPVLITAGRYDEVTPKQVEAVQERLPHSRSIIFDGGAHLVHLEQPEAYLAAVSAFLDEEPPVRAKNSGNPPRSS